MRPLNRLVFFGANSVSRIVLSVSQVLIFYSKGGEAILI